MLVHRTKELLVSSTCVGSDTSNKVDPGQAVLTIGLFCSVCRSVRRRLHEVMVKTDISHCHHFTGQIIALDSAVVKTQNCLARMEVS